MSFKKLSSIFLDSDYQMSYEAPNKRNNVEENKQKLLDDFPKTSINTQINTTMEHTFGTGGVYNDIVKIDGISNASVETPLTRILSSGITDGDIRRNEPDVKPIELGVTKGTTLESFFDPTHGSNYDNITRLGGQGSTKNLDIKSNGTLSRTSALMGKEPYIVHNIPNSSAGIIGQSLGYNRDRIPIRAAADDILRLSAFYGSPTGVANIAAENLTNIAIGDGVTLDEPTGFIMRRPSTLGNTGFLNFIQQSQQKNAVSPGAGTNRKPFKVEYSKRMNKGMPFERLGDKPLAVKPLLGLVAALPKGDGFLERTQRKLITPLIEKASKVVQDAAQVPTFQNTPFIDLSGGGKKTNYIDKVGLQRVTDHDNAELGELDPFVEGDFYVKIKDLRDKQFIYFRGFVTGITENVNPTFNPTSYIGRSEDVYTYGKAERDISFNLKVYPANFIEQEKMYGKLERLTSLAYPEYLEDDGLVRMKPPFTELYMAHIGTKKQGQFGFIKSISYTVNEQGDWDAVRQLPRLFEIAISYQILHKRPPNLKTTFYGAYR
tara:strand:+ start:3819 stop:5459 length:1641 start_codon:yes stop_codon:yes gene_type:complete